MKLSRIIILTIMTLVSARICADLGSATQAIAGEPCGKNHEGVYTGTYQIVPKGCCTMRGCMDCLKCIPNAEQTLDL